MSMRAVFIVVLGFASLAWADNIVRKDGTKVEGLIQREAKGWTVTDITGKVTHIPDDDVQWVNKVGKLTPADFAESDLKSLRRAVENSTDLKAVIARYQRFIQQNKATPAGAEAAKDLATWQDRLDRGLVKLGPAWVTAAEYAATQQKLAGMVDEVRALIKIGKLKEAEAAVGKVLAVDPDNASGLYLQGYLAGKQGQVTAARKALERVNTLSPAHGPTLNNLAVLAWQQRQVPRALTYYDQAMAAAPTSRQVLDNVAEALQAASPQQRREELYQRVQTHFTSLDAGLAREMEKDGLCRWGAIWVSKDQKAELDKAQEKLQGQLDKLSDEQAKVDARVQEIDRLVAVNIQTVDQMTRDAMSVDPSGRVITMPLPMTYYDMQRANDLMRLERQNLVVQYQRLEASKVALRQQGLPLPGYTGQQQLIGAEGTPLAIVSPATRPAGK